MTKPIIDDEAINKFSPYEAQAMLEKLNEIYGSGITPREATELHRLEKRLKARPGRNNTPTLKFAELTIRPWSAGVLG
jgi:hypothetical protein